jgi:DNA-binding HxlR family transcriptional regulator
VGDDRRVYRHFCMMARALEAVGERWSLPIVRDLLLGPQRFTDLCRSLATITPTRLTNRLRQLEANGIVVRDRPATGREVWYRLSEAGLELAPVVESLTLWGIEHALEPPRPDEPVEPAAVLIGTKMFLSRFAENVIRPVVWVWRFGDDGYTLRFDGRGWTLARGEDEGADVIVETMLEAWARFLTAGGHRVLAPAEIHLAGTRSAIREFGRAFGAEPGSG